MTSTGRAGDRVSAEGIEVFQTVGEGFADSLLVVMVVVVLIAMVDSKNVADSFMETMPTYMHVLTLIVLLYRVDLTRRG